MKKHLVIFLILTLTFTAFAKKTPDTVKIGVILPLTGNMAQVGQPQLAAIEFFKAECASGSYKHKYQIIVEDDAMTGRLSAEAANKFFNVDHVDAVVDFSSATGNIIAPRARVARVPHVSLASDPKVADGRYNFTNWTIPERESGMMVNIVQKLGGKRVAILTARHQGAMAIEAEFEKELKKRNIPSFTNIYFTPGERDFRTTLLKIREYKPDMFIPLAFSPELEIILRQRKQMGLKAKITTAECFDFLENAEDAEGLYYVSGSLGSPEFQKRILNVTNKPSTYCVPYTYESLDIIRGAYENSPAIDHDTAAQWIAHMKDFPSVLGTISTTRDGRIDSPAALFQIVHGKPVPATFDKIK